MQVLQHILFSMLILFISSASLLAQPPAGGRPPGGGPEEMISREKQALLEQITDLNDDQKALLDGIYDEFANTLKETFEESRGGDRESRREQMQALLQEKDELIADVLNEEQYAIYENLATGKNRRSSQSKENQPEEDED